MGFQVLVGLYFSFVSAKFSHATRTAEVVKNYLTSLRVPVSVCVCVCLLCVCVRLSASLACGFMKNWTIRAWGQKFVVYDVARCAAAIFRVAVDAMWIVNFSDFELEVTINLSKLTTVL